MLDPVAVALKFGFLAVLYLFLLWTVRSVLRDLRRTSGDGAGAGLRRRHGPAPGERVRGGAARPRSCASGRPPG